MEGKYYDLARSLNIAQRVKDLIFIALDEANEIERRYMEFLLSNMLICDLANIDGNWLLKFVRDSIRIRQSMPWKDEYDDETFLYFVLPFRINNENFEDNRLALFNLAYDKVYQKDMKQAVLDLNHFAYEQLRYNMCDARTEAPMGVYKSSLGRCGEQSVFLVSLLRAFAIPSRQVYVPRWAHSESNHAWVEVFMNGSWRFLGACEPEIDLDMAWFSSPVKRAPFAQANVIGRYDKEELVKFKSTATEINLSSYYAETNKVSISVFDPNDNPIEGAKVEFCVFNSGILEPLTFVYSDKRGETRSLSFGKGDLIIRVYKGNLGAIEKIDLSSEDLEIKLVLEEDWNKFFEYKFNPPIGLVPYLQVLENKDHYFSGFSKDNFASVRIHLNYNRRFYLKFYTFIKNNFEFITNINEEYSYFDRIYLRHYNNYYILIKKCDNETDQSFALEELKVDNQESLDLHFDSFEFYEDKDSLFDKMKTKLNKNFDEKKSFGEMVYQNKQRSFNIEIYSKILSRELNLDYKKLFRIFDLAKGNSYNIYEIIKNYYPIYQGDLFFVLENLREKDFATIDLSVILDALISSLQYKNIYPIEIWKKYILNPRIDYEFLKAHRLYIQRNFNFKSKEEIFAFLEESIEILDEDSFYFPRSSMSAIETLRLRKSDLLSMKVLTVAFLRSFGIPSYLDDNTTKINYYENGRFIQKIKDQDKAPQGKIRLINYDSFPNGVQFSLSKKEKDKFLAIFPAFIETEASHLQDKVLDIGDYVLNLGFRYKDGSVDGAYYPFEIKENEITSLELKPLKISLQDDKQSISFARGLDEFSQDSFNFFFIMDKEDEPAYHILNELDKRRDLIDKLNLLIYTKDHKDLESYVKNKFRNLRPRFLRSKDLIQEVKRDLNLGDDLVYPISILCDKDNLYYLNMGYKIGLMEEIALLI